jgi:hypothetical protein
MEKIQSSCHNEQGLLNLLLKRLGSPFGQLLQLQQSHLLYVDGGLMDSQVLFKALPLSLQP